MSLKVGEVAIVIASVMADYPVGSEVTILAVREDCINFKYLVDVSPDGITVWGNDQCLRRKPGSGQREPLGSWSKCPWQPETHHAEAH
jgi:hypothetical protein